MDPRTRKEPAEDPNVAIFKQAACNVTQLFLAYKNASADNKCAREDGYADALADILSRLDQGFSASDLRNWIVQRKREGSADSTDENMAAAEIRQQQHQQTAEQRFTEMQSAQFTFTAQNRGLAQPTGRTEDTKPDVGELLFEYIKNNTNTNHHGVKRRLQDRGYPGGYKRGRFQ